MRALTVPDPDELRELRARGEFFWLDLADPDSDALASIAAVLQLHELALEDTQEFGQRPKADTYPHEMLGSFRRTLITQRQVFDRAVERLVALTDERTRPRRTTATSAIICGARSTTSTWRATASRAWSTPTATRCRNG
jgi:Mg2+ and Co2+ transporter CorA